MIGAETDRARNPAIRAAFQLAGLMVRVWQELRPGLGVAHVCALCAELQGKVATSTVSLCRPREREIGVGVQGEVGTPADASCIPKDVKTRLRGDVL